MIQIEQGRNSGLAVDRLFTSSVNLIQSTVIRASALARAPGHFKRPRRQVSDRFAARLGGLGLDPKRFWWGPMTMAPHKCEFLANEIESCPPRHVLEIGCGASTAVLAGLARKLGFTVLSLENHQGSVEYVEYLLQGLDCNDRVTIQKCGFVRSRYPSGKRYRWYDADLARAGCKFDFVVVDGPMKQLVGRDGFLPQIIPFLAQDHRIYIDDWRAMKRIGVDEWAANYPEVRVEAVAANMGLMRVPL